MPAPSQLSLATSSVLRLLKEELSYHKELVDQEAKVKVLSEKLKAGQKSEDGNDEFILKQEVSGPWRPKPTVCPSVPVSARTDRVCNAETRRGADPGRL